MLTLCLHYSRISFIDIIFFNMEVVSPWTLGDPHLSDTTLSQGIGTFRAWLSAYGDSHPDDRSTVEDWFASFQLLDASSGDSPVVEEPLSLVSTSSLPSSPRPELSSPAIDITADLPDGRQQGEELLEDDYCGDHLPSSLSAKDLVEPKEGYNEATRQLLARIPPCEHDHSLGCSVAACDKRTYEGLLPGEELSGALMITLLGSLVPPPHIRVSHILLDGEDDLQRNEPPFIDMDKDTRTILFAHHANNHWSTLSIRIAAYKGNGRLSATCSSLCSLGRKMNKTTTDFYRRLIIRSINQAGFAPGDSLAWKVNKGECVRQSQGDTKDSGLYVLYNINRLVNGSRPSLGDKINPEQQRWIYARHCVGVIHANMSTASTLSRVTSSLSSAPVSRDSTAPTHGTGENIELTCYAPDHEPHEALDASICFPSIAVTTSMTASSAISQAATPAATPAAPSTATSTATPSATSIATSATPLATSPIIGKDAPPCHSQGQVEGQSGMELDESLPMTTTEAVSTAAISPHGTETSSFSSIANETMKGINNDTNAEDQQIIAEGIAIAEGTLSPVEETLTLAYRSPSSSSSSSCSTPPASPSPNTAPRDFDRPSHGILSLPRRLGAKRGMEAVRDDGDQDGGSTKRRRRGSSNVLSKDKHSGSTATTPPHDMLQNSAFNPINRPVGLSRTGQLTSDSEARNTQFQSMSRHVFSKGALTSLKTLLVWHMEHRNVSMAVGIEAREFSMMLKGLDQIKVTRAQFKEASQHVECDVGLDLLQELVRRYHLAVFGHHYEKRKRELELFYKSRLPPGVKLATLVNGALLKETVFRTYDIMMKHVYQAKVWTGLLMYFGIAALVIVDLAQPKTW